MVIAPPEVNTAEPARIGRQPETGNDTDQPSTGLPIALYTPRTGPIVSEPQMRHPRHRGLPRGAWGAQERRGGAEGHDETLIFGIHAVEAALANPRRTIAKLYLTEKDLWDRACRFDVVAIDGDAVTHLEDAFQTTS